MVSWEREERGGKLWGDIRIWGFGTRNLEFTRADSAKRLLPTGEVPPASDPRRGLE